MIGRDADGQLRVVGRKGPGFTPRAHLPRLRPKGFPEAVPRDGGRGPGDHVSGVHLELVQPEHSTIDQRHARLAPVGMIRKRAIAGIRGPQGEFPGAVEIDADSHRLVAAAQRCRLQDLLVAHGDGEFHASPATLGVAVMVHADLSLETLAGRGETHRDFAVGMRSQPAANVLGADSQGRFQHRLIGNELAVILPADIELPTFRRNGPGSRFGRSGKTPPHHREEQDNQFNGIARFAVFL